MIMDSDNINVKQPDTGTKKRRNPFTAQQQKEDRDKRRQKRARLIIRNISYKTTDESLKEHFAKYGNIIDLNILKRPDGKLVGCAFIQFETVNQAAKAILQTSNKPYLGRVIFVDWAVGKNEFDMKNTSKPNSIPNEQVISTENSMNETSLVAGESLEIEIKNENIKEESDSNDEDANSSEHSEDEDIKMHDDDKLEIKEQKSMTKGSKQSNDVKEGCTIFIKNVPFEATSDSLRKVCRKYGPIYYALINTDPISKHSKGTAFVKFKTKESADLCLQAGDEFILLNSIMQPLPALSQKDIIADSSKTSKVSDSRNLYLVKEGLIMTGSKAAEGVSASDLSKRHKLEQVKASVLKDLNRFVSRNRLSIHNLPPVFDDAKLKDLIIKYTNMKPHECRVMRENKPSVNAPLGKSKGFGFMSFNTHLDALNALRKLNNNPNVFSAAHRPIVGFSIEDRSVHNIKEKRLKKSRENNPTFKNKLEKLRLRKQKRKLTQSSKTDAITITKKQPINNQKNLSNDKKSKIKKNSMNNSSSTIANGQNDFAGEPAKPGSFIRMRSNKKIREQSMEHKRKVGDLKRKEKQKREKRMHRIERKQIDRTKSRQKKSDQDNLSVLVNKYKGVLDARAETQNKLNKKRKSKWYID